MVLLNALLETFSFVYSEIMFTIISFGIRAGGGVVRKFFKINKLRRGRLFGTREYDI